MLEPFATIVVNSILSTRSTLGHPHFPLQSVARTAVRPARKALAPDFFTPHPRSVKGKEKAIESSDPPNMTDSFSARSLRGRNTKDPPSCLGEYGLPSCWMFPIEFSRLSTVKNRSPVVKETICRRYRPLRRHPSHHLPHLHLRRPSKIQIHPNTTSLIRHTSTITAQSDPIPADDSLHTILNILDMPVDEINADRLWGAYCSVVSSGALASVSIDQLLDFAEVLWAVVGAMDELQHTDVDMMHRWGKRLMRMVDAIPGSATADLDIPISHHDHRLQCLRAQAHAFMGNIHYAIVVAHTLVQTQRFVGLYALNKTILNALRRRHNPVRTLEIVIDDYPAFERHIAKLSVLYLTLSTIHDPVGVLRSHSDWDPESKLRAGELLIRSFCKQGHPEIGLAVYHELTRKQIFVPGGIQAVLVRYLGQAGSFHTANRLFADLHTISRLDWLCTGLHLYAQQGDIERVEACYAELEQNFGPVSPINQAIRMYAYAVSGQTATAVSIFNHLFRPSPEPGSNRSLLTSAMSVHYEVLILAHARAGDISGVAKWLQAMSHAGYSPTTYVYNDVLKCLAARGELEMVSSVLDQMRESGVPPNRVSYTTVITLLAHRQDPVSAEAVYKRAMREGIVPDRKMLTSLMNAHVEAGSWKGVIRVFDYLASGKAPQARLTIETCNTLLKAYVLIGAPFKMVSRFFVRLEEKQMRPDEFTFALLIQSACDSGDMATAEDIFGELESRVGRGKGKELKMTAYVLTIMISGYLRLGDHARAKEFYDRMRQQGIQPTSVTFRTMLKAYEKDGSPESLQMAEALIRTLLEASNRRTWDKPTAKRDSALEHVYRPVMAAYARQARPEDVERLFQEVLNAGGEPTLGLLTALLDAYRRSSDLDGVKKVWTQMVQVAVRFSRAKDLFGRGKGMVVQKHEDHLPKINTMCVALSIYIDALSDAGLHDQIGAAWAELQQKGFGFDVHNWNHLAVALVRAGDVERGFGVIEKVLLPYGLRAAKIQEHRTIPDAPLSFDDAEQDEEDYPFPKPYDEPLRRTEERARAASKANRIARSFSEDMERAIEGRRDDFAQGLHALRQILPSWNVWAPHDRTLRALLSAILRLESGILPGSGRPSGEFDQGHERDHGDGDDHHQYSTTDSGPMGTEEKKLASSRAREILGRIYKDFPKTVQIIANFERRERRRLKRAFDRVYR